MNQIRKIGYLVVGLLVASLYGCGASVEDQVSESVEKELSNKFRGFLVDPKVEVTAFESNGSSVSPEYKARFVATTKFFEPTYEKSSTVRIGGDEWVILREKYPKGGEFKLFGNSTSTLRNEELVTVLSGINGGDQVPGVRFSEVPYGVVEGSDAHKVIVAEVKKIEEVKQKEIAEMRDKFLGQWTGTYTCVDFDGMYKTKDVHSEFGLRIYVVSNDPQGFAVIAADFADAQKPRAHEYVLEGKVNKEGFFDIKPVTWLNRVGTQGWAGFTGRVDEKSGELIGDVKFNNCRGFKLKRST
ncbi:hypothetical protein [Pseudomonas leptonychotis]|uniref:hypothetical protein n=1 Tax=Pseudomonas leptonychotis TaxID=2448482 RepID=UPI0039F08C09